MIKVLLEGKYDLDSFSYYENFIVTISNVTSTKILNFGDRIVYTKFNEEELDNPINWPYYNLLGKAIGRITLIHDTDSKLLKKIEDDTGGFYSLNELKHYILILQNYGMEVITFDEVVIEDKNEK